MTLTDSQNTESPYITRTTQAGLYGALAIPLLFLTLSSPLWGYAIYENISSSRNDKTSEGELESKKLSITE